MVASMILNLVSLKDHKKTFTYSNEPGHSQLLSRLKTLFQEKKR